MAGLLGGDNAQPPLNIAQLLPLLLAANSTHSTVQPLANAAPTFNSPTGGSGASVTPPNFGGGAMMPQGGGGNSVGSMLPLLLAMNKQNNGGGGGGKGGGGGLLGSLFGGKGGSAPSAMDMLSYGGLGDVGSANSIAALAGGFG